MKKIFFGLLLLGCTSTGSFASGALKNNPTARSGVAPSVPSWIKNDFYTTYHVPEEEVTWHLSGNYIAAAFRLQDKEMKALYTPGGDLVGTEQQVAIDQLPQKAQQYLQKQYGASAIQEAILFEPAQIDTDPYDNGVKESAYFVKLEMAKKPVVLQVLESRGVTVVQQ